MDDLSLLDGDKHWLGWLGPEPKRALREELESLLRTMVPGTVLESLRITEEPRYLTGGRRDAEAANKVLVTRAALAVHFDARVSSPGEEPEELRGVFSWVAAGLDGERRDRAYVDFGDDVPGAVARLEARIYELDSLTLS